MARPTGWLLRSHVRVQAGSWQSSTWWLAFPLAGGFGEGIHLTGGWHNHCGRRSTIAACMCLSPSHFEWFLGELEPHPLHPAVSSWGLHKLTCCSLICRMLLPQARACTSTPAACTWGPVVCCKKRSSSGSSGSSSSSSAAHHPALPPGSSASTMPQRRTGRSAMHSFS